MSKALLIALLLNACILFGAEVPLRDSPPQPLAANCLRVVEGLEMVGQPLPEQRVQAIETAASARNSDAIQQALDPEVMFVVSINPEGRVNVAAGEHPVQIQQAGYVPFLIKILNEGSVTSPLSIDSPQAGATFAGSSEFSLQRQQQTGINDKENPNSRTDRFLDLAMLTERPLTDRLSGEPVEYAVGLIYSSEAGSREATLHFDTGQGSEDLGFRAEIPVLFDIRPAVRVRLDLYDADGTPTVARLEFRDERGRVYPPQARRIAPDFFFQQQIYRQHGTEVLLPPGRFQLKASRGPEYRVLQRTITVPKQETAELAIRLQRWIDPSAFGFYSGDHHIHAAGCAHYQLPTQGVSPYDMFLQVKGEGLNVGCVLTWGPCFEYQRQFFSPQVHSLGDPKTKLKYDLEISGFGSAALGHVCLLNLRDQSYPGSDGTSTAGWPTWTVPVLQWAKSQGAITGYAHSASGMQVVPEQAVQWILQAHDTDKDQSLSLTESEVAVLPAPFKSIDLDRNQILSQAELITATDRAADELPNLAMPGMNGVGAMELPVSVVFEACDFISAMDTARIQEWNTWYHILNCGFSLKVSGETDFPCMSSTRVGQGRVYVQMGEIEELDFAKWCEHLAQGKAYVSDGFAHALKFEINGQSPGDDSVNLAIPGDVTVEASVAFAPATPQTAAQGLVVPPQGTRLVGDTVQWNQTPTDESADGGIRAVELIVNGKSVETQRVPADGRVHDLTFTTRIERSSWVALRQFPQLHTNPIDVLVEDRPIRASRQSARWCAEIIRLLWNNRERSIAPAERAAARKAYDRAIERYEQIAVQSETD